MDGFGIAHLFIDTADQCWHIVRIPYKTEFHEKHDNNIIPDEKYTEQWFRVLIRA